MRRSRAASDATRSWPPDRGGRVLATMILLWAVAGGDPDRAASQPRPVAPEPATVPALPPDTQSAGPPVATDALLLAGGTVAYALAAPWIRPHFLEHFSLERVGRNLADPIGRLGAREDDDGFFHNYVSHPLVWGGLGVVLRERGYGAWAALAVTQAHSVWWEYVVEGAWKPPSKVDVVTNFVAPLVTIFALPPALEALAGTRPGPEPGGDSARLDPRVRVVPAGDGGGIALSISVSLP